MSSVLEDVKHLLRYFAKDSGVSNDVIQYLNNPERFLAVNIPMVMDNGKLQHFIGYRSRYSTLVGPAKGGIRFHADVNPDIINALALLMVLKNSLAGLPYGGGKGGVAVDVNTLSLAEKERLSRLYIRSIADSIGENIDIPASDIGINSTNIGWMSDEYNKCIQKKAPATITGKPISMGGSLFRTEATGFGVYLSTIRLLSKFNKTNKNTTIAIQGFGNVGLYTAKFLYEQGYKIIAISDVKNGIFDKNGIDVNLLINKTLEYNKSSKSTIFIDDKKITDLFPNSTIISNDALLGLEVDVLILAAIDNVITDSNVDNVKSKYIIEGANAPISQAADEKLAKNGVIIVPDILANAGGVIVSYFEWVQNIQAYPWNLEEVKNKLTENMENMFEKVWNVAHVEKKSLRCASYAIALRRLEESIKAQYSCL